MKLLRIVLAVLLTAALLYVARTNSRGRPEHLVSTQNGYTFEITTVPKGYLSDLVRITVAITGDLGQNVGPEFRWSKFGQDDTTPLHKYDTRPLEADSTTPGLYYTEVGAGQPGGRLRYYFEVRDNTGGLRASFTEADGKPFVLKYVGHVPSWVVACHIFFIFATVFFVAKGTLHGIDVIRGRADALPVAKSYFWAVVCAFIGGYPFGFAMNWYTFGSVWEGVPFGTDATDNKTQLLFVYLVFVLIASIGTLTRGKLGRDAYSQKAIGVWGVIGLLVALAIYLIPHSIQFSPGLTIAVCWSWIGLVVLIYVVGLVGAMRRPHVPDTKRS